MVGRLLKDTAAAMLAAPSGVAACLGGHQLWEYKPKDTQDDECDEGELEARSNTGMLSATLTVNHSFPAQGPSVLDGAPF